MDKQRFIEECLVLLLTKENALDYNKNALLSSYSAGVTEEQAIAQELCGLYGKSLALEFMSGHINAALAFMNLVDDSVQTNIPLLLRACNLFLINVVRNHG